MAGKNFDTLGAADGNEAEAPNITSSTTIFDLSSTFDFGFEDDLLLGGNANSESGHPANMAEPTTSSDNIDLLPIQAASSPAIANLAPSAPTPGLSITWAGTTESQAGGFTPPDCNIAAGLNNIITVVNDHLDIYSKTGTDLQSSTLNSFFGFPEYPTDFIFDPKVTWDQFGNRFIVTADDHTGSNSTVHVAVSRDSNPLDGWYNYTFNVLNGASWLDYPVLGLDGNTVYLSGNYFDPSNNYTGATVIAFSKSALESGSSVTGYLYNPTSLGAPSSVLYTAAHMYGAPAGFGGDFLVDYAQNNAGNDTLQIISVQNAGTGSATFSRQSLNVGDISDTFPAGAPEPGTASLLPDGDTRLQNAVWSNNTLYAVTEIRIGSGSSAHDVVHWFVVDTTNLNSLTLLSQGNIDYGAGTATYYGNLTVDSAGDMIIGYSFSSGSVFPSSAYAVITPGGTGLQDGGIYLQQGQGAYTQIAGDGRIHWGDYSGVAIDPTDSKSFWVFNQYATSGNSWATTIGGYSALPSQPPSITPTNQSVAYNQSVAFTPNIFTVSGSGITQYQVWFSDPAHGFPADGMVTDVNGAIAANTVVTETSLSNLHYIGGPASGTDKIWLRAFDGAWSGWTLVQLSDLGITPPSITPTNQSVAYNQSVAFTPNIFTVSGSGITQYQIWFSDPAHGFPADGMVTDAGGVIPTNTVVNETSLSNLHYIGGGAAATDDIWLRAFNGSWSGWTLVQLSDPGVTPPTVTPHNQNASPGQQIAVSPTIFTLSGPAATAYQLYLQGPSDGAVTDNNGSITTNTVVNETSLAGINFVGGASSGSDQLWLRAFDGTWSGWTLATLTDFGPGHAAPVQVSNAVSLARTVVGFADRNSGGEPLPARAIAIMPSDYTLPAGWSQGNLTGNDPYVVAPDGSITYLRNIPQGALTSLTSSGNWSGLPLTPALAPAPLNGIQLETAVGFGDAMSNRSPLVIDTVANALSRSITSDAATNISLASNDGAITLLKATAHVDTAIFG